MWFASGSGFAAVELGVPVQGVFGEVLEAGMLGCLTCHDVCELSCWWFKLYLLVGVGG